MRTLSKAALTSQLLLGLGALVMVLALLLGVGQHREAQARDVLNDLRREVSLRATALDDYFARAQTVNLMLADNPAFRAFYQQTDAGPHGAGDHGHPALTTAGWTNIPRAAEAEGGIDLTLVEVNRALAHLESLFPDSIGEACFIDVRGFENARVVRGEIASVDDLSPNETGAEFFAPTTALDVGSVHQARPYISPDTDEWVVSNSTMIEVDGQRPAMVHFEVTLESFRATIRGGSAFRAKIVDAQSGVVLLDSAYPEGTVPEVLQDAAHVHGDIPDPGTTSWTAAEGELVALARINRVANGGNANDWVVAVSAPESSGLGLQLDGRAALILILGGAICLLGVTRLLHGNEQLQLETTTDELTGLLNRRGFVDALAKPSRTGDDRCHVAVIDLNRFKQVNDSFGHETGDVLLRLVAQRLQDLLPADAAVGRLGGDEFAFAIRGSQRAMRLMTSAVSDALSMAFALSHGPIVTGAAIGVASIPQHTTEVTEAMRFADIAMYHAKRHGQPSAVYSPEQDPNNPRRAQLHRRLTQAISEGRVDVHFQPQVDVATRRVVGLEALARWTDPDEGPISPAEFIPLAEGTGLMPELTALVIDRSVGFIARHLNDPHLTVSVNVSPRSLVGGWVVRTVGEALERWSVPPDRLVVELTEDLLVGDSEVEIDALRELREMGCGVSIDDFGTGHSSLSYLSRLPADELKIDRTFVANVAEDASMAFILRSTIDLGQNLNLRTVAEGVETEAMMSLIGTLGCDVAQGWLFAPPLPAREATAWIRANRLEFVGLLDRDPVS